MNVVRTVGVCLVMSCSALTAEEGRLVCLDARGRLNYSPDEQGNRIPDFSRAGYMGGGVALPDVPVRKTLDPLAGEADDTARIQKALDEMAALSPDPAGFRGALLLKKGTYRVGGTLAIKTSGVVLRGEGQKPDGTVLLATGRKQRTLITVSGGKLNLSEVSGTRHAIVGKHVPWGTSSVTLDSVEGLTHGCKVIVYRPGTEKWIHDLGMDRIPKRDGTVQWTAKAYGFSFERTVKNIQGTTVILDAPLVQGLDECYGGGVLYRYEESGRIEKSGVEQLRLVSEYQRGKENSDEDHAWTGVSLGAAANCWVRNVTTVYFSHAVHAGGPSIFTTIQDCACLRPVSLITGGRRYPFGLNGQFGFAQRCYSDESRHAESTGAKVCGPNVFLDCLADHTHSDTGPHHRWAVGILWDNLKGGAFNAQDRQYMGSGHGWAGAQQVFWNCETSTIACQKPPTAQNYAIGCTGKKVQGAFPRPEGHFESQGAHVEPRSLYLKQLEERLGPEAVRQVTIEAQRTGPVYDWLRKSLAQ